MRYVITTFAAFTLAACTSEPAVPSSQVRQIDLNTASSCRLLDRVVSNAIGADANDSEQLALNSLKSTVGIMGGNAFTLTATETTSEDATVTGNAYRC